MMQMKYVVVQSEKHGKQLFVFPIDIDHDRFAEVLSYIKTGHQNWSRDYREPVSAGFTDGIKCFGESTTLKLKSHPEDTDLLLMGGHSV